MQLETVKEIKILCGGEKLIDISDLHWFQGKLKTISHEKFHDLKESLKKDGLPLGFHVWDNKKTIDIMDGHHRWLALTELRKEGWTVPKVPVNFVKAKNKKEAAKIVLLSNARYARMNEESIGNFMIDFELSYADMKFLDFADVRAEYFAPNDSLAELEEPTISNDDIQKSMETPKTDTNSFEAGVQDVTDDTGLEDIREEKMDVTGKRFVIIIDCKDADHKEILKKELRSIVESSGAKFF